MSAATGLSGCRCTTGPGAGMFLCWCVVDEWLFGQAGGVVIGECALVDGLGTMTFAIFSCHGFGEASECGVLHGRGV